MKMGISKLDKMYNGVALNKKNNKAKVQTMNHLKKAAISITSKLGLLNTHRTLVIAISEEQKVYENMLKLVLARVNAATSLLKWAKKEENNELKESICQLYDISLLWATVQREFAEKSSIFIKALQEILQVEAGLDAIRAQLKHATEKKENLEKKIVDAELKRKVEQVPFSHIELQKLKDQEQALQTELDGHTIKAEIFKGKAIKDSLLDVMAAQSLLAKKMSVIFATAEEVVNKIPDVPGHLKSPKEEIKAKETPDCISILKEKLDIQRPIFSNAANPAIFHVELSPPSNKKQPKFHVPSPRFKKGLDRTIPKIPKEWEFNDFVIISNNKPPKENPPPVPDLRKRSNTVDTNASTKYEKPFKEKRPLLPVPRDASDPPYVEANMKGLTQRSSSDSEIPKSAEYNTPWEHYMEKWSSCEKISASEKMETELRKYDKVFEPLDSSDYDDTNHYHDMINHQDYEELIKGEHTESGICVLKGSQRYLKLNLSTIEGIHDNDSNKNNNDSTSDSDEDDYAEPYSPTQESKERGVFNFDESNIQKEGKVTNNERIQSKPDASSQVIVIGGKKLPKIPRRTNALKQENNGLMQPKKSPKKTSVPAMIPPPVKRNQDPKPLPKPRPKTVGNLEIFCEGGFHQDQDKSSGNVRSLAHQLQGKIKPVPSYPNITQVKLKQTEYSNEYQNSFQ